MSEFDHIEKKETIDKIARTYTFPKRILDLLKRMKQETGLNYNDFLIQATDNLAKKYDEDKCIFLNKDDYATAQYDKKTRIYHEKRHKAQMLLLSYGLKIEDIEEAHLKYLPIDNLEAFSTLNDEDKNIVEGLCETLKLDVKGIRELSIQIRNHKKEERELYEAIEYEIMGYQHTLEQTAKVMTYYNLEEITTIYDKYKTPEVEEQLTENDKRVEKTEYNRTHRVAEDGVEETLRDSGKWLNENDLNIEERNIDREKDEKERIENQKKWETEQLIKNQLEEKRKKEFNEMARRSNERRKEGKKKFKELSEDGYKWQENGKMFYICEKCEAKHIIGGAKFTKHREFRKNKKVSVIEEPPTTIREKAENIIEDIEEDFEDIDYGDSMTEKEIDDLYTDVEDDEMSEKEE